MEIEIISKLRETSQWRANSKPEKRPDQEKLIKTVNGYISEFLSNLPSAANSGERRRAEGGDCGGRWSLLKVSRPKETANCKVHSTLYH